MGLLKWLASALEWINSGFVYRSPDIDKARREALEAMTTRAIRSRYNVQGRKTSKAELIEIVLSK